MDEIAVEVSNVSKTYKVYDRPYLRIIEALTRNRKKYHFTSNALKNVSFKIPKGTVFGIVGKNGSGKSTILQIIASVLQPTAGNVRVSGKVSALLELGSGFNPDFTGLDNVYLYGSILGMSREEISRKLPDIAAFANIGEYINLPLKTYSSGMVVRLAFATAVAVEPEILIVDEALAVGDANFQHECTLRIRNIIQSGATVIFVSHDLAAVKMLCQRAVLLERGEVVAEGDAESVAKEYHRRLFHEELQQGNAAKGSDFGDGDGTSQARQSSEPLPTLSDSAMPSPTQIQIFAERTRLNQFGSGEGKILYCEIADHLGTATTTVGYGETITIRVYLQFSQAVDSAVAGFVLRNGKGVDIITSNTHIEHSNLRNIQAGETRMVSFSFTNTLKDDHYSISPAVCDEQHFHQARPFHWIDNAAVFRAGKPKNTIVYSVFYPENLTVSAVTIATSPDTELQKAVS